MDCSENLGCIQLGCNMLFMLIDVKSYKVFPKHKGYFLFQNHLLWIDIFL